MKFTQINKGIFFLNFCYQIKLEAQWAEPVSLTFHSALRKLYTETSIGASYQIWVQLATRLQSRRYFRNQPISNKNCLWWPCLLTDWDQMSRLYRGPSIDTIYQVTVYLAKRCKRRGFCLEIDQSETRIACGSHVCWQIGMKWAVVIENLP
jgi:hypothetical protein